MTRILEFAKLCRIEKEEREMMKSCPFFSSSSTKLKHFIAFCIQIFSSNFSSRKTQIFLTQNRKSTNSYLTTVSLLLFVSLIRKGSIAFRLEFLKAQTLLIRYRSVKFQISRRLCQRKVNDEFLVGLWESLIFII